MKYKFRRYKTKHKGKCYYILVPEKHEELWVVDWADNWYEGCFIDGSAECLQSVIAGFGTLAFNPYLIIYFPIRKSKIPNTLDYGDNGMYDMVFCTNRVQLKLSEWKSIRNKLKHCKWTTYKFDFNLERMKKYFKKNENIRMKRKMLKKAGANMELRSSTAFFCFPQCYYQKNAVDCYDYFMKKFEENDFSYCYDAEKDHWICYTTMSFVYGGVGRKKFTYERPYVTFYLELYDLDIINRYKKKKVYYIEKAKIK